MTTAQLGELAAFLSSCTWAIGSVVYSRLSRDHTAFAVNFSRALFALPLFLLCAFCVAGGFAGGLADYRTLGGPSLTWFLVSAVASYGLGDAIFFYSTQALGVPGALAIASSYPVWTAAIGRLFLGQPLSFQQGFGIALAVAGLIAVILFAPASAPNAAGSEGTGEVYPQASAEASQGAALSPGEARATGTAGAPKSVAFGVTLAALASFFWAMNGYAVFRGGQGVPMAVANTARMGFAFILSPVMGKLLAAGRPVTIPFRVLRTNAWLFVMEAFGGSALFVYGLVHAPLAIGVTLSALAPVISVPISLALGLERFSGWRTAGVTVTVVGLRLLVG